MMTSFSELRHGIAAAEVYECGVCVVLLFSVSNDLRNWPFSENTEVLPPHEITTEALPPGTTTLTDVSYINILILKLKKKP